MIEMEYFLPIGSVVKLKDANRNIMIIGILPIEDSNEERIYDYLGVPFPEGFYGVESTLSFYNTDIEKVVHSGYINEETKKMNSIFQMFLEKVKDSIDNAEQ